MLFFFGGGTTALRHETSADAEVLLAHLLHSGLVFGFFRCRGLESLRLHECSGPGDAVRSAEGTVGDGGLSGGRDPPSGCPRFLVVERKKQVKS